MLNIFLRDYRRGLRDLFDDIIIGFERRQDQSADFPAFFNAIVILSPCPVPAAGISAFSDMENFNNIAAACAVLTRSVDDSRQGDELGYDMVGGFGHTQYISLLL